MYKEGLDIYDKLPEDMVVYLRYNGRHFNHKLCDYAVSKMKCEDSSTGELVKLEPYNKDEVDAILHNYNIKLNNNDLYDYVYVANMCKADFLHSSIIDEQHLALYIKDVIDDVDGYDGIIFNRWYADMCRKGIPIDWESFI